MSDDDGGAETFAEEDNFLPITVALVLGIAIATVVVVVRRELAPRRVSEKRGKIHHDHLVGEQGALAGLYVN